MLFNIVFTNNDTAFERCSNAIEKAYFDPKEYNKPDELNPKWKVGDIPSEEKQIEEIQEKLEALMKKVCSQEPEQPDGTYIPDGKYIYFDCNGTENEKLALPFINRFHRYFLERRWNKPPIIDSINVSINELVCLETDSKHTRFQNCSKNFGNYNHFINVVNATARLINYFTNKDNIIKFLHNEEHNQERWREFAKLVVFKKKKESLSNVNLRIFNLMLAAFLHDIGKTIVDHRHGMEGAIILSEHTSLSWYQLNIIASKYAADFQRNDLLFVADLLSYHDQFGTLSTGEAGYAQLNDLIQKIKRYSLKHTNRSKQVEWSQRYLFDLWLLNIADIIVSVKDKWKRQREWLKEETSIGKIEEFLTKNPHHIYTLTHDLHISNQLLHSINNHRHTDIYYDMREMTQSYSDRHVVERINRLICTCILKSVETIDSKTKSKKTKSKKLFQKILDNLKIEECLSESEVTSSIERAVSATRGWEEFCCRFSWIGQMDYSLGFFIKICLGALDRVDFELQDAPNTTDLDHGAYNKEAVFRTKWIREKCMPGFEGSEGKKVLSRLNAKLFVENFTVTVVKIIDHLLFREKRN